MKRGLSLIKIILILLVATIILECVNAVNYTVCSSGCNSTNITSIFTVYDLGAGDIVEIQADSPGGSKIYNESVNPPAADSGNGSGQVIIMPRSGDNIIIDGNSTQYAISLQLADYITFKDLTLYGGTNNPTSDWALYIANRNWIRIENINAYGNSNSQYGIYVTNGKNVTIINCSTYDFQGPGVSMSGVSNINVSFFNCTDNSSQDGLFMDTGSLGGIVRGFTSTNADRHGIWSAGHSVTYYSNISNATVDGYRCTRNCTSYYDIVYNSQNDGFHATAKANFTINYGTSFNNGNLSSSQSGDGYTAHAGDNLTLYYCMGYHNLNTGLGVATSSLGSAFNSIFYNNGVEGLLRRSNIWIDGGNWTIKNSVAHSAYKYESQITSGAISGLIFDFNNNFYKQINNFIYGIVNVSFTEWQGNTSSDENSVNGDPSFVDAASYNFNPTWDSGLIDSGVYVGLTSDFLGNPLYGSPDIGIIEYQPPYNISQDIINTSISKNIRIYADGKYRHINSSNDSILVNLTIGQVDGFNASDRVQWMDVNITNWNSSFMNWTETTGLSLNTTHTIKGLIYNGKYRIFYSQNGTFTELGTYIVNSEGNILFNYTQGYSTVSFVVMNSSGNVIISLDGPTNGYNSSTSYVNFNWTAISTNISLTCNLTMDGSVNNTSPLNSINATTRNLTIVGIPEGLHSWNITCHNGFNANTSSTMNFTVDTTAPQIITLDSPAEAVNFSTGTVNFNWTATDSRSTYLYCNITMDGIINNTDYIVSDNATTDNYTIQGISDGSHQINITCYDWMFNRNTTELRNFTVDTASPRAITLDSPAEATTFGRTAVDFNWTATDSIATYLYCNITLDGTTNNTAYIISNNGTTDNYTIEGIPDGSHQINVTCYDWMFNSNTTETRSFSVDTSVATIPAATAASEQTGGSMGPSHPTEGHTFSEILPDTPVTYKISDDSIGITEFTLTVISRAKNVKITAKGLSSMPEDITAKPEGDVYRFIEITKKNIENDNIATAKLKFNVDKSWLEDNGFEPSRVVLAKYIEDGWANLPTDKIGPIADKYLYEAESKNGFSIFAITAIKEAEAINNTEYTPRETEEIRNEAGYQENSPLKQPKWPVKIIAISLLSIIIIILISIRLIFRHKPKKK